MINYLCIFIALQVYIIILLLIYYAPSPIFKFLRTYIVADIPIFQISDDSNFHTIEEEINYETQYRYSLFFLSMGGFKIYIFTYQNKFEFLHILSFEKIMDRELGNISRNLDNDRMREEIKYLNCKKKYIDILKDSINTYNSSIQTAKVKGTFYFTLIGAIISVYLGKVLAFKVFILTLNIIFQVLVFYIIYLFINFTIFLIQFHSVKTIDKETYTDFTNVTGETEEKKYFKYFYKNMIYAKFFSFKDVSYIKNIEFYLKKILIFLIIGILLIFLYN